MVVVFLILGLLFLLTDLFLETFPAPNRYLVGGVLILWAGFRGWLAWQREKRHRNQKDEHDDEHHDADYRRS